MSSTPAFRSNVQGNVPYFQKELQAFLGNLSVSVKAICLCVICTYLLSFWSPVIDAFSVTPGHLLPPSFRIWTLITSPFLEIHLWEVIIDIATVGLCGKLIEPLWGQREMSFFFVLANLSVTGLSVSYYLFLYTATSDPDTLFSIQIHGLAGYIGAMTVAVRQVMPDTVIFKTPLGKLTNRNVPLTVLITSIIAWAIGLLEGVYCTMFGSGVVFSWIYLRFYQRHLNGSRGDPAENFNFASFFPNVIQPPIAFIANLMFSIFVKIGLCRKYIKRFQISKDGGPSSIHISMPKHDLDSERRRQKALKLLSERLGSGVPSRDESKRPLIRPESPVDDDDNNTGAGTSANSLRSNITLPLSTSSPNLSLSSTPNPSSTPRDNVVVSMSGES